MVRRLGWWAMRVERGYLRRGLELRLGNWDPCTDSRPPLINLEVGGDGEVLGRCREKSVTVSRRRAAGGPALIEVGRRCFAQSWRPSTNVEGCNGEGKRRLGIVELLGAFTNGRLSIRQGQRLIQWLHARGNGRVSWGSTRRHTYRTEGS